MKVKTQYVEGRRAKNTFEKAMTALFQAKKSERKQEPKAPASKKSSDANDKD